VPKKKHEKTHRCLRVFTSRHRLFFRSTGAVETQFRPDRKN
jgi:hypothetical protein